MLLSVQVAAFQLYILDDLIRRKKQQQKTTMKIQISDCAFFLDKSKVYLFHILKTCKNTKRGNQKLWIEERHTIQRPPKIQKTNIGPQNTKQKTNYSVTWVQLKTGDELRCHGRVSSVSPLVTPVLYNLVKNPMINHEREKNGIWLHHT